MGLFKKKETLDILQEKKARLAELTQQSSDAVDLVTRTISNLEFINEEIDDTVSEIDGVLRQFNDTRDALQRNRSHNAAIITNFSKLICVD